MAYAAWWAFGWLPQLTTQVGVLPPITFDASGGIRWPEQLTLHLYVPPLVLAYGAAAVFWILLFIPLAIVARIFRRIGGARFTIKNALIWTLVAALAAVVAQIGAGWKMWGQYSIVPTFAAATTCAVAATAVIAPRISASAWRLCFTGLLMLGAIGMLNTVSKPAQMSECLVLKDARLWLALHPLAQSTKATAHPGNCAGVLWADGDIRNQEVNPRSKASRRQQGAGADQEALQTLLKASTGNLAYERSMAAWWAAVALAVALNAALLTTLVLLSRLAVASYKRRASSYEEVDRTPGWLPWAVLPLALASLLAGATWVGSTRAPPIALSLATLRPLVLLALDKPIQTARAVIGIEFGQAKSNEVLEALRQRNHN